MDRRNFIKSLGFGAACFMTGGCDSFAGKNLFSNESMSVKSTGTLKRPNVVLVITDDQGYGDLSCHGNGIISTPNLDKLYSQSCRLTNFHVGPTCAPTRAGLMTGRYCNRTGVWHTVMGRSLLRKDEKTIGDVFKTGGYKTAMFGKWHLGDNYPFRPEDRGFDEVLRHGGGGVTQTPDYWCNDYFDDTYYRNSMPEKHEGYCTDIWFGEAMKFIETNKNRPFFCYLATNAPHSPFNVEDKYSDPYEGKSNVPNADFYGMIVNIDENMAKLDQHLKNLGLQENTILIFMTDNGTSAGFKNGKGFNDGMRGTKGSEYEGGHRVPFFIRWPGGGIEGGYDVERLTAHIDVLPTLADLCKIDNPWKDKPDGTSIKPLLYGKDENWPDRVLVTDSQRIENPVKWRKSATMTDRWRLINGDKLYDMDVDPGQNNNIASSHPDVVSQLRGEYEKWWQSVSERFDEYCRPILGNDAENPATLTGHDGHGSSVPWNQGKIRNGVKTTYFWAVDIEREGEYEFELRRWPKEADAAIRAGVPATAYVPGGFRYTSGDALNITKADIKINDIVMDKPVSSSDKAISFTTYLQAGPAKLEAWFTDSSGVKRGAYYVYAKRLN